MRMPRTLALSLAIAAPGPLAGQWTVALEVGVARFGGTSRDSSGASVRPYRPTTFGVRVDRGWGATRIALAVLYAQTGLAGEGNGVAFVDYGAASLLELAAEVSIRVARFGAGVEARVEGGPALDVWTISGSDTRTRLGGLAGLALEWPLGGRFTGSLRATGALSESTFNPDEIPAGVERLADVVRVQVCE